MKLIKFDLPMNGKKVKDLEELTDNMTVEILAHYKSGLLGRWLKVRQYENELSMIEQFAELDEPVLLKSLCDVFGIEIDRDAAQTLLLPVSPVGGVRIVSTDLETSLHEMLISKLATILGGDKPISLPLQQSDLSKIKTLDELALAKLDGYLEGRFQAPSAKSAA